MEVFPLERTLTQIDYLRLTRLLVRDRQSASDGLEQLLTSSELVSPAAVAPDIVTMYSQLLLADADGIAPFKLTLCYPGDADPARGFVSVLSPVGLSLLGLRVGATARWQTPRGPRAATVLEILFQPEASGDYTT
jgi:regulator of nucleoside diphosphate kinase